MEMCFSFDMTKCAVKSNVELASDFIVGTCQVLPKSFAPVSDHMHNIAPTGKTASKLYVISCGSNAEFYIRPVNECIADIDVLMSSTDELAYSGDFPALPSDVSGLADMVECYKIESYQRYPGFVRLRVSAEMIFNWEYNGYNVNHRDLRNSYKTLNMATMATEYNLDRTPRRIIIRGPAITLESIEPNSDIPDDYVRSVWCPQWPREAQNWHHRPRNHRWPTIDTISEVVRNGCHVVFVQHRNCKDDREQWRFSFSVAEIILLQSWTKIQQIVYHLLRFFAKRELIGLQKMCPKEGEAICTYHLKTLMLWACEEMSPELWKSSSVVAICIELLKELSKWINRRYIPNYFIPEANLFNEQSRSTVLDKIEWRLKEFYNPDILCHWFVEYYIMPVISAYLPAVSTRKLPLHLLNCFIPSTFRPIFQEEMKIDSLNRLLAFTISDCHKRCRNLVTNLDMISGVRYSLNHGYFLRRYRMKTDRWMALLPMIDSDLCFSIYDNLLHILHTVHSLMCGKILYHSMLFVELVKAVSMQPNIIRSRYHNFPKSSTMQGSKYYFLCAQDLMKNLSGSNNPSEFQLIVLMSKNILKIALACVLECDGFKSRGILHASLAYLASLHFATSQFQQAKQLAVVAKKTPQTNMDALNAGCLLFIDDVARIVGLCVLHKMILGKNVHYIHRRLFLDLRLSPYVFANYLKVLLAERILNHSNFYYDLPDSAFPMDECLTVLIASKCIASAKSGSYLNPARQVAYRRADSETEAESMIVNPDITPNSVITFLMEYALENMTSFYDVIRRDFVQCNTDDCYRALYLYKCRKYDEVMQLCEAILHDFELPRDIRIKGLTFGNVFLVPPLDLFFDEDVQFLLGFHTLFYCLSPFNDALGKLKLGTEPVFAHLFAHIMYDRRCGLSFTLVQRDPIRCYYFLGRHYLAKYLKVKCCIDCNLPYSKALTEFTTHKTKFPFELIIRSFLLHKISFIQK